MVFVLLCPFLPQYLFPSPAFLIICMISFAIAPPVYTRVNFLNSKKSSYNQQISHKRKVFNMVALNFILQNCNELSCLHCINSIFLQFVIYQNLLILFRGFSEKYAAFWTTGRNRYSFNLLFVWLSRTLSEYTVFFTNFQIDNFSYHDSNYQCFPDILTKADTALDVILGVTLYLLFSKLTCGVLKCIFRILKSFFTFF